MKKVFLVLTILFFGNNFCFAQQIKDTSVVKTKVFIKKINIEHFRDREGRKSAGTKCLVGKIQIVTLVDIAKGTKSEIVVIDDKNMKHSFLLKSTTTIYDANWKAVDLESIRKGLIARIRYITTKEGIKEAKSISFVKNGYNMSK